MVARGLFVMVVSALLLIFVIAANADDSNSGYQPPQQWKKKTRPFIGQWIMPLDRNKPGYVAPERQYNMKWYEPKNQQKRYGR